MVAIGFFSGSQLHNPAVHRTSVSREVRNGSWQIELSSIQNFYFPIKIITKFNPLIINFPFFVYQSFSMCLTRVLCTEKLCSNKFCFVFIQSYLLLKPFIIKDECIYGLFKLSPNQSNRRDLDIDVQIDFEGELSNLHEFNKYKMRWIFWEETDIHWKTWNPSNIPDICGSLLDDRINGIEQEWKLLKIYYNI